MYVNVKYYVLYRNTADDIDLPKVQGQHEIINMCFNGLNASQSKIPKTGKYAFSDQVGVPAVVFLPENSNNLSEKLITRVSCQNDFQSLQEVVDFLKGERMELLETNVNIIIAPLRGILGQTTLGQNVTVVDGGTVGTALNPGKRMEFGQGMTLVHELGHVFGLTHTWNSSKATVILSDIPIQRNPNHTFKFTLNKYTGEADAMMCNRMRDCQRAQGAKDMDIKGKAAPYSWITALECDKEMFEMGCNFMDYASDENMAMFTKTQAQVIRGCVLDSKYKRDNGEVGKVSSTRKRIQSLSQTSTWWNTWEAVGFGSASTITFLFGMFGILFKRGLIWILCAFGVLLLLVVVFAVLTLVFSRKRKTSIRSGVNAGAILTNGFIRLIQISESSATVSWSPPISSTCSVFLNNIKVGDTNESLFKFESLDAGSTYEISVKTGDVTNFTLATVTLPREPQEVSAIDPAYTSIRLVWKKASGNARILYNVYQDNVSVGNTEDTEMTINGLIGGSSYNFGVSAQTQTGESTHTNISTSTIPNEIRNLLQTDCDSHTIWCEFETPIGYYVSFKVYLNDIFLKDLDSQQTRFSLSNLLPSTNYDLRVTSLSNGSTESMGTKINVTTFGVIPAPKNGQVRNFSSSGCTLRAYMQDAALYSYHIEASAFYLTEQQQMIKYKFSDFDVTPTEADFTPTEAEFTPTPANPSWPGPGVEFTIRFVPHGTRSFMTFVIYAAQKNSFGRMVLSDSYLEIGQDIIGDGFIFA